MATAVAGAVPGIHPFDQPDVEASKHATRKLTAEYEARRALPAETALLTDRGVRMFTDESNASELAAAAGGDRSLDGYLKAHLSRLRDGDYCALLAYIDMTADHERILQAMRDEIRTTMRVATYLQFGPRFLHSTGQAYKGGPNNGVFLQITCEDAADLQVPGRQFTFGVVKAAQARGDFQVLVDRERRALRLHLGADVSAGLEVVQGAVRNALGAISPSPADTARR
jgi:transaldolase/glucose-6-phosphate isomerase